MKHLRLLWIALTLIFLSSHSYASEKAFLINIRGPIGPAAEDLITRNITKAETSHAAFVILQIDTPGGLESSMRGINQAILNASLPVIAYVAPLGASVASAGTFILYASHISAMAPGTHIGPASPVFLLPSGNSEEQLSVQQRKAINNAKAYIRSLAQLHGRNAEWAELAVTKAVGLPAAEAKKLNVVDEIANNLPQLLQKLNGKALMMQGKPYIFHTEHLVIETVVPNWRYDFLSFITNPNVAYLLMLVALYGLLFEFLHPGFVVPGVAGLISLVLALYAFQLLPVNFSSVTLLLIGVTFMVFEVYVSSFGVIGILGIFAFFLGSVMLFSTNDPSYHLAWPLIFIMCFFTAVFFFYVLRLILRTQKRTVITGHEGLIGQIGVVLHIENDYQSRVRVLGEIWNARSDCLLVAGQTIKVIALEQLTLIVTPQKNEQLNKEK